MATKEKLSSARGRAKVVPVEAQQMSPSESQPNLSTYSGRLAAAIRDARKAKGWTVEQLADAVTERGYPLAKMTLYGWENGRRDPHLDALPFVAKALGMKLHAIMPAK